MSTSPPDDRDAEIVGRLLHLQSRMRSHFEKVTAELGLSPAEGHALHRLENPQPMGAMAESMRCDASYITLIADSLESQGLVERRSDRSDRRIKQLALTAAGRRRRQKLVRLIHDTSPAFGQLDDSGRDEFLALLRRIDPS